jgi:endonuclease/exonuclease/phosphatase family metal-dependent hydrolase
LRAAVVGCLLAALAACTTTASAGAAWPDAGGRPPAASTPPTGVPVGPLRVLQFNLCNSGYAACYSGRSIAQAATVIHSVVPDLVTLNEICQGDLPDLQRALAQAVPDHVVSAFQATRNRRTGDLSRCRNGQPYGIGLVSRWPSVAGSSAGAGFYPTTDTRVPEERAWLCLTVAASPVLTVCTTHLADRHADVATAQCRYLFGTVIAEIREREPVVPVVLGGDLNLGPGDSAYLRSCLPPGSALADDGGVQHVVATPDYVVSHSQRIDMAGTTDHPGLLVALSGRGLR